MKKRCHLKNDEDRVGPSNRQVVYQGVFKEQNTQICTSTKSTVFSRVEKQNYNISTSFVSKASRMCPINCVSDTGAGPRVALEDLADPD